MKIFHLLAIPDLTSTVKSTDFAQNDKYVEPGSLLIPLEKRFPIQPDMPIQNPNLTHDVTLNRSYKFTSEMRFTDKEFMKMALEHAVAEAMKKRISRRADLESGSQKIADQHAVEIEALYQRESISKGWVKRFHMEKVFQHLGVKTLDEFKRLMHRVHHKQDLDKLNTHKMMLRQNGKDASKMLSPFEIHHLRLAEEEAVRMKLNLTHKELILVDDMKRRLAEQFAAMAKTQISDTHQMFSAKKKA